MEKLERIGGALKLTRTRKSWRTVYYLYFLNNKIAYVGSALVPKERLRCHQHKFKQTFKLVLGQRLSPKQACALEIKEIKRLHPPLNARAVSNLPSMLGRKHTVNTVLLMRKSHKGHIVSIGQREKMRVALLGRKLTSEHRESIRQAKLAHPPSKAARKRFGLMISKALKGKPFSAEHKIKIANALKGRKKSTAHCRSMRSAISAAYARRRAQGLPTGSQMRQGSWRDKFLFGKEALLAGKKLNINEGV